MGRWERERGDVSVLLRAKRELAAADSHQAELRVLGGRRVQAKARQFPGLGRVNAPADTLVLLC